MGDQVEQLSTDRAVYAVPVRDSENQMDGWTLIPEADPIARVRAVSDFHEGNITIRVDHRGILHPNRPDEIEIDRTMEG